MSSSFRLKYFQILSAVWGLIYRTLLLFLKYLINLSINILYPFFFWTFDSSIFHPHPKFSVGQIPSENFLFIDIFTSFFYQEDFHLSLLDSISLCFVTKAYFLKNKKKVAIFLLAIICLLSLLHVSISLIPYVPQNSGGHTKSCFFFCCKNLWAILIQISASAIPKHCRW